MTITKQLKKTITEHAQEQLEKNKKRINEIFCGDFSFSIQEGKITYLHIHDTTKVKESIIEN